MRWWHRGVLAAGYGALAFVGLIGVVWVRPGWLCKWLGHAPKDWTWSSGGVEEGVCRYCETKLARDATAVVA